jgi:hypothetical protein
MRKRTVTGVVLAAAVAAAGLATAPGAVAGPAERLETTVIDVSCAWATVEGGFVYLFASAVSPEGVAGAGMFVESPDGEIILDGEGGSASFGPEFAAAVQLHDVTTGQPVGEATVEATMTQLGDPVVEEVRERDGNRWTRGTVTVTEFTVDATSVVVPGHTIVADPLACAGDELVFDVFTTNPAARVNRFSDFGSGICQLDGIPGGEVRLSRELREPVFEVIIDDDTEPLKAAGSLALRGWSGTETAPLVSLFTGEVVGDLTIDVTVRRDGQRGREAVRFDGTTFRVSWVPYVASISVTTSDGQVGTAECHSEDLVVWTMIAPRSQ